MGCAGMLFVMLYSLSGVDRNSPVFPKSFFLMMASVLTILIIYLFYSTIKYFRSANKVNTILKIVILLFDAFLWYVSVFMVLVTIGIVGFSGSH